MDVSLRELFNLYDFSTGRRLFALGRIMKAAGEQSFPELEAHCAIAIKQDRYTRTLENRWAAPAERTSAVQPIDVKVDRALVAIRDVVQGHAGEDEEEEPRMEARALLTAIFPEGVVAVIQLPYVEELSAVERILETLKGKKFAPLVAEMGLGRKVKHLTKQAAEYRAALEAAAPEQVAFDKVRAARADGQDMLLQAVAMIVGKHRTRTEADVAARVALLGPILEQNEAIRLYLKARRAVQDVNPDTGALDLNAPAGEAPAAPAASPGKSDK